ncbi:hypothetical protein ACJJI3_00185 [Microbulbifer sp. ZKSA004]|uniref:hypothetical protein n=1 Tax=Microbulbifer sp. ZKSA004 TaxID=3243389 RepID=UPI00403A1143
MATFWDLKKGGVFTNMHKGEHVTCKGCGYDKKLIDAHIIPKFFYMELRADGNHLNVLHAGNERIGRSFKGDYDNSILCKDCDGVFEKYDDYAKKILINGFNLFRPIWRGSELLGWELPPYDFSKIKLFFLSVLWRASISTRPFFKGVDLGMLESDLKEIVFNRAVDIHNRYTIMLCKFLPSKSGTLEKTIIAPEKVRVREIVYYKFYMGGYIVWVKIDKRMAVRVLQKCELRRLKGVVLATDFYSSVEYGDLEKAMIDFYAE